MTDYNLKEGLKILKKLLDDNSISITEEQRQALNDFYFKIVEYNDMIKDISDIYEKIKKNCKMKTEYLNDSISKEDAIRIDVNYMPNKPRFVLTAEELKNKIKNKKNDKLANRYGS